MVGGDQAGPRIDHGPLVQLRFLNPLRYNRRVNRTRRYFAAWLAFVGIAFNALWPVVVTAEQLGADLPMVDCPHTGLKMLDLDRLARGDHKDTNTAQSGMQCVLCALGIAYGSAPAPSTALLVDIPVATVIWQNRDPEIFFVPNRRQPPAQAPPTFS